MTFPYEFSVETELFSLYQQRIRPFWQQHVTEGNFSGVDNATIRYAAYLHPDATDTIVISPGRIEGYIKYQELLFDLANNGFSVFIIDHRGQGFSSRLLEDGHKGYVETFSHYIDDFEQFINTVVEPTLKTSGNPNNIHLLAHSMGGAISALYLAERSHPVKRAVLSAPMFGINTGAIPTVLAKNVSVLLEKLTRIFDQPDAWFPGHKKYEPQAFERNILTHSENRYRLFRQVYDEFPDAQLGGITIRWLIEAIAAMDHIPSVVQHIKIPMLILTADDDTVIENTAHTLIKTKNSDVISQRHYAGSYHELLFERDVIRQAALTDTLDFFKSVQGR